MQVRNRRTVGVDYKWEQREPKEFVSTTRSNWRQVPWRTVKVESARSKTLLEWAWQRRLKFCQELVKAGRKSATLLPVNGSSTTERKGVRTKLGIGKRVDYLEDSIGSKWKQWVYNFWAARGCLGHLDDRAYDMGCGIWEVMDMENAEWDVCRTIHAVARSFQNVLWE